MMTTDNRTNPLLSRAQRIAQGCQRVLERLDKGEPLSAILAQAEAVAERSGSMGMAHWVNFEMYGPGRVPKGNRPPVTKDEKEGFAIWLELHSVIDASTLSIQDEVSYKRSNLPERTALAYQSIAELEQSAFGPALDVQLETDEEGTWKFQSDVIRREHTRVIRAVRDYLHGRMSHIHEWAIREQENQALLGPNYHIVVSNLDALETGVGQELLAALDNLRSENPANWSLAVLGCRNVILKLGRTLWPSKAESYVSELVGRTLDMKGERELNRLQAFMDYHFRKAPEDKQTELRGLDETARKIHAKGSGGKRGSETRLEEAQGLVVDTFEFVSALGRLVGLEPVIEGSAAP